MRFIVKPFNDLSAAELHDIYKLRSKVFVVEQNCVYLDIDDKDHHAHHMMLLVNGALAGYARLLAPGVSYPGPGIGRVVIDERFRKTGLGKELMKQSLSKTLELFNNEVITISAQSYLREFYMSLGFKPEGDEYLEDGIPHIKMHYHALAVK